MEKDIVAFLEKLADYAHHNIALAKLLEDQPENIKQIVLSNDSIRLKKLISDVEYFADPKTVTQA